MTERADSSFIPPNMDPQRLRHFLAVYEHKNFGRAAADRGVSQQAVSKSIAKLEESLGLRLFDRTPLGAQPTLFADALARRARIIISEAQLASTELAALRGSEKGRVRIGLGWTYTTRIAPLAIERFRKMRPGVSISITVSHTANLLSQLLQGQLDFVASAPAQGFEFDPSLKADVLFVDHDALILRPDHPLCQMTNPSLEDLTHYTWLLSLQLNERWQQICNIFTANGLTPPEVIDTASLDFVKSMLQSGDYVSSLSEENVALELAKGDLVSIRTGELDSSREAIIVERKHSPLQAAASAFRALLVEACHEHYPPIV